MTEELEKGNDKRVIATRKEQLIWVYVLAAVLSITLIAASAFILRKDLTMLGTCIFMILTGVTGVVVSSIILIGYFRTPKEIIVYENGVLHYPRGTCNVSELINVEYRRATARGLQYKWGTVKLILNDKTVSCRYVADVEQVHGVLIRLMMDSKSKN
ncbi:MAG: hypothetical protein K2K80_03905 [Clostridia bacterium]|nr:hypothetical protein [Clostridia bacterium]